MDHSIWICSKETCTVHTAHTYIYRKIDYIVHPFSRVAQAAASSIEKYFQEERVKKNLMFGCVIFSNNKQTNEKVLKRIFQYSNLVVATGNAIILLSACNARLWIWMRMGIMGVRFTVVLTLTRAHPATQNFEIMKNEKKKNILCFTEWDGLYGASRRAAALP